MVTAKLEENKDKFIHRPNAREFARDIVSVADCVCETTHPNGIACEWGGALQRFAMIYVQQGMPLIDQNGVSTQHEIRLSGITMGGTGHGSKYNTRIGYIPVFKHDLGDCPLADENFKFFDGYLVDFIDKIKEGLPLATTKIRHDSGVTYDGCVVLVHEARSSRDDVEILKLLMGLCKMLPYSQEPYGWFSTSEFATFVKAEINPTLGRVEYSKCHIVHNNINSTDMARKVTTTINLIKILAGILAVKESSISTYMQDTVNTRDDPQKRQKTTVQCLSEYEGIFCVEKNTASYVDVDKFATKVMKPALNDMKHKHVPYSVKGTR